MRYRVVVSHIMGVGSAVRTVGCFVEACEAAGTTVDAIEFGNTEPTAIVDITVSAAHGDAIEPTDVTLDDDGRLELTIEPDPIAPTVDHEVDIAVRDATIEPDGSVQATLGISVPAEAETAGGGRGEGSTIDKTAAQTEADDRDRDRPAFEDPELLASIYDSCETFAEMSEAIEMDVTAETVRRYMIEYGIHEPASYGDTHDRPESPSKPDRSESPSEPDRSESASKPDRSESASDRAPSEASSESADAEPVILTDGVGLPEDVTVETLVDTVSRSNTIYEVRRDLGLDRSDTVDLLAQLDLVDLVVGRASTSHERSIGREAIVDRLRDL